MPTHSPMAGDFADNPIVYHLLTDRFAPPPRQRGAEEIGDFHGGKLSGVTRKLEEGWFARLGVNAILISAPYQQILGWIPGGEGAFRHYAYHGYFALDYTVMDERIGCEADLRELVASAHRQGIRVLLDVVMNHPGYGDLESLDACGVDVLRPGWRAATPGNYHDYIDFDSTAFQQWWGADWVRAGLPGYQPGGTDDLTMSLAGLPDFRTESAEWVALPPFLARKPDTRAIELPQATVRTYLIAWLADWVRRFGIDGFRCDSAKHVELDAWLELKQVACRAREQHGAEPFWMLGEVFGHGIERNHYFDFGFDSLLNFHFQHHLAGAASLEALFDDYAGKLAGRPGYNVLSYISSHDTQLFDRSDLMRAGTALLLSPGGVLVFYGDETARPPGHATPADATQATRSDMNWQDIDEQNLAHWRKLGQFRQRHVAIARGRHSMTGDGPYSFTRADAASGDKVLVALDCAGLTRLRTSGVFAEGEAVRDAYSGWRGRVQDGHVCLHADRVVLLETDDVSQADTLTTIA
ncbi:alpha-amylase family glycosyl hydrolase [Massilia sp. NR 4-1]|uniref:alpha-amylase family glycosyl hydrolase n=1 Tax=Massilia sp. NR 4-1 TaxID=1678028 RepID=UPI000AE2282F|nr:alpha-amylase family glycosyl hydrolase [Massilia sp. NR 4-1]